MTHDTLSHAERLAQRLIDGDGDEATYHELRFEAMAMAHAWQSTWLAEELVAIFDKAGQDGRERAETAAIVQGMLRGVRLARANGAAAAKSPAWANPALTAAGITTLGMIAAAVINQYGGMKAASHSQATVQPAVVKPNIQIVIPSSAPVFVQQQAPAAGHAAAHAAGSAKPAASPPAAAAPKASAPPVAPVEPAAETPAEPVGGT
jgi:hypothetical protein